MKCKSSPPDSGTKIQRSILKNVMFASTVHEFKSKKPLVGLKLGQLVEKVKFFYTYFLPNRKISIIIVYQIYKIS